MGLTKLLRKIATGSSEPALLAKTGSKPVNITKTVSSITVQHNNQETVIERNQDIYARINDLFAKTSRPCPPFCIQPMSITPNIETIGELEMLDYLQQSTTDKSVMVIDSRIKEWVDIVTIPSTINIPWTSLTISNGITLHDVLSIMTNEFDVRIIEGVNAGDISKAYENNKLSELLDFSNAKTLVLFCNGSWCSQTPESAMSLLELSYPEEKLKYFRDGMQGWLSLGLTTVSNDNNSCNSVEPVCKNHPYKVVS